MGPKRFQSQNFSLFIVKLKKLGFSAPLCITFANTEEQFVITIIKSLQNSLVSSYSK